MEKDQVTLEIKQGWKIYQTVAGTVALACISFLMKELVGIMEYAGAGAMFLLIFFPLVGAGVLYSVIYAFKHRIIFDLSGMRRKGIIKEKVILYDNISEFQFTDSFWKLSPVGNMLGSKDAIMIDFKYKNTEEARDFLKETVKLKDRITLD